jgi:hypothetical protein
MMTPTPGRNRRRRGKRGQRPRQDQQHPEQQAGAEAAPPVQEAAPQQQAEAPSARPERQERAPQRADGEQQRGDRQGGNRKRSRGKRRTTRRPTLAVMPTEVLREEVRDLTPTGTMYMRTVEEMATEDGVNFGCPMLTRTQIGMPFADGVRMPRCSMGWALHNEEEASFCMRTPDLLDCWKAHSDREAALRATSETENAAD